MSFWAWSHILKHFFFCTFLLDTVFVFNFFHYYCLFVFSITVFVLHYSFFLLWQLICRFVFYSFFFHFLLRSFSFCYSCTIHNPHTKFVFFPWHLLVHVFFIFLHLQVFELEQLPTHWQKLLWPPIFKYISWACRGVMVIFASCALLSIPISPAFKCGWGSNSSRPYVFSR